MRYDRDSYEQWSNEGFLTGLTPVGRVTVEPNWQLRTTSTGNNWGNSERGPYRYWQTQANNQIEYELPNVKSISWDRSLSNDIASAKIVIMNQWHDQFGFDENASPASPNILGKPGYFWPGHGLTAESQAEWNQSVATGAYRKDGTYDANFTWDQVLVPYALLRTYEGYAGETGNSVAESSTGELLNAGGTYLTGVWLVERVEAGSDGLLTLSCKDIGKLLIDQIVLPPTVPDELYPLEYYPDGETRFDSYWEPSPTTGVSIASQARVPAKWEWCSWSAASNTSVFGHLPSHSLDRNSDTFSISSGATAPRSKSAAWQFAVSGNDPNDSGRQIEQVAFTPWAGGYTAYLSVYGDGNWKGVNTIPALPSDDTNTSNRVDVKYVAKITVPRNIPDGTEKEVSFSVPDAYKNGNTKFRITLQNHYYGNFSGQGNTVYRAGIREVRPYNTKDVPPLTRAGNINTPWTFAMAAHPIRGYWVVDNGGVVYGFGDAEVKPFTNGSTSAYATGLSGGTYINNAISMAAHPDGEGYWVLRRGGHIAAYGSAACYQANTGQYDPRAALNIGNDPFGADPGARQAFDIAATSSGNGYFVILGDGVVCGYGDALDVSGWVNGSTQSFWSYTYSEYNSLVDTYMNAIPITILVPANNPLGFTVQDVYTYNQCRRGTTIAAHPVPGKKGFWASNGSGQVRTKGDCVNYGMLYYRVFNQGQAGEFRLTVTEFTHAIRPKTDGKGYWIAFGSGHIAQFGSAVGDGPTDFYAQNPSLTLSSSFNSTVRLTAEVFKALIWDLAPDPDGSGFWLLAADGSVGHYNAKFWGQPSFWGRSGVKWFEGNYQDYSDIVKEMLLWAGWLFYDPTEIGDPPVYGSIESTGIPSEARLPADKFDKRTIADVLNELKQITGYSWWIGPQGDVHYESPNWWSKGNFDTGSGPYAGEKIWVTGSGNQVAPGTSGASLFVPEISEKNSLLNYQASLDGTALRSEIIIGNESFDSRDPTGTGFVRHYPSSAYDPIKGTTPSLRGIPKPAMWINKNFTSEEEMELMAELINLQIWFSQRAGSIQIFGWPGLEINDQISIKERTTSETFLHYVRGISSTNDLDAGEYTMNLSTNWLGDEDDWVITATPGESGFSKIRVSNRVDTWQSNLGLGLPSSLESVNVIDGMVSTADFTYKAGNSYWYSDTFVNNEQPWIYGVLKNPISIEDFTVTLVQASGGQLYADEFDAWFNINNQFFYLPSINEPTQWAATNKTLPYLNENGYAWQVRMGVLGGNYRGPLTVALRFSGSNIKPCTVLATAQQIDDQEV